MAISAPCPSWSVLLWRMSTRSPSGTSLRSVTSRAHSSLRRNAPAKPSASSARSRLPISVAGQSASMLVRTSAVAGAWPVRCVPIVRLIPRSVAFTRSALVGGSMPTCAGRAVAPLDAHQAASRASPRRRPKCLTVLRIQPASDRGRAPLRRAADPDTRGKGPSVDRAGKASRIRIPRRSRRMRRCWAGRRGDSRQEAARTAPAELRHRPLPSPAPARRGRLLPPGAADRADGLADISSRNPLTRLDSRG
jgi:hypothetical protein